MQIKGIEMCPSVIRRDGKRAIQILIAHVRHCQFIASVGQSRDIKRTIYIRDGPFHELGALRHTDIHKLQRLVGLPVNHLSFHYALSLRSKSTPYQT